MISDCFPMEQAEPCHGGGMTMKWVAKNCPHTKGSRFELQGVWPSWVMLGEEEKNSSAHVVMLTVSVHPSKYFI